MLQFSVVFLQTNTYIQKIKNAKYPETFAMNGKCVKRLGQLQTKGLPRKKQNKIKKEKQGAASTCRKEIRERKSHSGAKTKQQRNNSVCFLSFKTTHGKC